MHRRPVPSSSPLLPTLLLSTAVAIAACGDDGGGDPVVVDASITDGAVPDTSATDAPMSFGPVDAGPDVTVFEGDVVTFAGSTDLEGDLIVQWDFGDGFFSRDSFVPSHLYGDDGTFTAVMTVTRGAEVVGVDSLTVTVDNVAPAIVGLPDRIEWTPGFAVTIDFDIDDPGADAHTVEIDWGDGASSMLEPPPLDERSRSAAHVFGEEGTFPVVVTVTDDDGGRVEQPVTIEIWDHQILEIEIEANAWVVSGERMRAFVHVKSTPPSDYVVALDEAPAGMILDRTDLVGRTIEPAFLSWTPADAQGGEHRVAVRVTAGTASATAEATVTVSARQIAASRIIDPAFGGGTVEVDDPASPLYGVRLDIPAGALDRRRAISISTLATPPPDTGQSVLGPVIKLSPSGLQFLAPVTLTVPVDPAGIPAGSTFGGSSLATYVPGDFALHGPGDSGRWIAMETTGDEAAGTMVAELEHFTEIAPIPEAPPPEECVSDPDAGLYVSPGCHFRIHYELTGGDSPTCTAEERRATPERCEGQSGAPYVADPAVSDARGMAPDYVVDVGAYLESTYERLAPDYPVELEDGQQYSVTLEDTGVAAVAAWLCVGNSVQIPSRAIAEPTAEARVALGQTIAHELFHLVQCNANLPDTGFDYLDELGETLSFIQESFGGGRWLAEATAEHIAVRLFPGDTRNDDQRYLFTRPIDDIDDPEGYPGFVIFHYLLQRHGIDLTRDLYGGDSPDLYEEWTSRIATPSWTPADQYLRRKIGLTLGGDARTEQRAWLDFALAYQLTHDEDWILDVDRWGGFRPVAPSPANRLTGAEREDTPLELIPQAGAPAERMTELPPGHVATFVADLIDVCDDLGMAPTLGAPCKGVVGTLDPLRHSVVLRPSVSGPAVLMAYYVPLDRASMDAAPEPVVLGPVVPGDEVVVPLQLVRARGVVAVSAYVPWTQGYRPPTQISVEAFFRPNAHQLASGLYHTCVRRPDLSVWCWGHGEGLAIGSMPTAPVPPTETPFTEVEKLIVGDYHTCAIEGPERRLRCAGADRGSFGLGEEDVRLSPVEIPMPGGARAASNGSVCGGAAYGARAIGPFFAVDADGNVWAAGDNHDGALGVPYSATLPRRFTLEPAPLVTGVTAITSAGGHGPFNATLQSDLRHGCAIREDERVVCWGSAYHRQDGGGIRVPFSPGLERPRTVGGVSGAIELDAGYAGFNCALERSGHIKCWGHNYYGQVGQGSYDNDTEPAGSVVDETLTPIDDFVDLDVVYNHACGVHRTGLVSCWGGNVEIGAARGPLHRPFATVVPGISNAIAVGAGFDESCALTADGRIFCWADETGATEVTLPPLP